MPGTGNRIFIRTHAVYRIIFDEPNANRNPKLNPNTNFNLTDPRLEVRFDANNVRSRKMHSSRFMSAARTDNSNYPVPTDLSS